MPADHRAAARWSAYAGVANQGSRQRAQILLRQLELSTGNIFIEMSQGRVPNIYYYPEANKWMETLYMIYEDFGYGNRIKQTAN